MVKKLYPSELNSRLALVGLINLQVVCKGRHQPEGFTFHILLL